MVLTEEQKQDVYPKASMETAQAATENALYSNIDLTRFAKIEITGYPADGSTSPNDYVAKLNGNGNKIGPSILLKVMAGDKFNVAVSSWYKKNGASPGTPVNPLTGLVAALAGGISKVSPVHGTATTLVNSGVLDPSALSFLNSRSAPTAGKPKAYLNWILLNEQLNIAKDPAGNIIAGGYSGADPVGTDQQFKMHVMANIPINKNGYLYIYVSNETPNIDVFFDNLQVTHIRGQILEETHYYPFGLTMAGISSKAAGGIQNRRKFNDGTELENGEFSDGSGLELYATEYRSYDPQIGRFHQIDVLCEYDYEISPFVYARNNPILLNDPLGLQSDTTNKKDFFLDDKGNIKTTELEEVVVTSSKKSSSVGQPGLGESLIPVWGSARAAVDDFQNGRWGWGIFNTVMAVTDVFLVKSLVTATGKLVAKAIYKTAAEEIVKSNTQRLTLATIRSMTRETLLELATSPKLKSVIDQLYRPGAKIGNGGTADFVRIVGDAGHIEKAGTRITGLQNLINSGELKGLDLDIAIELRDDLIHAVSTVK